MSSLRRRLAAVFASGRLAGLLGGLPMVAMGLLFARAGYEILGIVLMAIGLAHIAKFVLRPREKAPPDSPDFVELSTRQSLLVILVPTGVLLAAGIATAIGAADASRGFAVLPFALAAYGLYLLVGLVSDVRMASRLARVLDDDETLLATCSGRPKPDQPSIPLRPTEVVAATNRRLLAARVALIRRPEIHTSFPYSEIRWVNHDFDYFRAAATDGSVAVWGVAPSDINAIATVVERAMEPKL